MKSRGRSESTRQHLYKDSITRGIRGGTTRRHQGTGIQRTLIICKSSPEHGESGPGHVQSPSLPCPNNVRGDLPGGRNPPRNVVGSSGLDSHFLGQTKRDDCGTGCACAAHDGINSHRVPERSATCFVTRGYGKQRRANKGEIL